MAWRFKASKYKNAAPIVPKPETCIRDICVGSYQTFGNNICASAAFMAFNWEHVGSSLAVLPLDDCGRKSKTMPLLHAHSDTVTDMEFSPFHDGLLLTGSQDSLVKVWHIPPEGLKESLSTPECTLSQKQRRVENVGFHPVADGLIHVASGHELALWDLTKQKEAFVNKEHTDVIQSTCWKKSGDLLATSCKDKLVRIIDPRSNTVQSANSHQNIKDSRVACLSENRLLTTGFDAARLRQVILRDMRNLSSPLKTLELDCSTGVLMPLYDHDTNMLFLAGKGDTTILYMELADREPFLLDGLRHSGEQTKGACLVPKRALRVMEGEVNRILQLTGSSVIPIMYQVPRKSYRDYHADLYPDTAGPVTYLNAPMWIQNQDYPVPNISLHPDANKCVDIHRGNLEEVVKEILAMPVPKKGDAKKVVTPKIEETPKPVIKQAQTPEGDDEDRIDFVNVKDLIKGMEKQKPKPVDYSKETNGFHKKIVDNGHDKKMDDEMEKTENGETEKSPETSPEKIAKKEDNGAVAKPEKIAEKVVDNLEKTVSNSEKSVSNSEKSIEKTDSSDSSESLSRSNSVINGAPPKPLPRSSISEGGSNEEYEIPKPKPRTTATATSGYKPRLGPKPFSASSGSEEFSFDKVFSVPVVPGMTKSDSATSPIAAISTPVTSTPISKDEDKDKSLSPTSDNDIAKEEYTNGKSDTSLEEEVNSSDSGYRPKTPSTAERRKLFEANNVTDGNPPPSTPAQSIADRRRAYELRSASVAVESETPPSPAPLRRRDSLKSRKSPDREDKRASVPNVTTKRTSTVFGKVSKFRHLKGTPAHKSTHVENIKNVSRQISGECNGFYANGLRCAIPITGGGGRVAIIELPSNSTPVASAPRPRPGVAPPALLHPAVLQDWGFDPFRDDRVVVACDDGAVREWLLPEGGLKESTNTPNRTFSAHPDKIYIIRFHPTADNILTTAAHDLTVKLWDLTPVEPVNFVTLTGHNDQIFAMDWSPCGRFLATVCKDGLIRIFDPRASTSALRSGKGPAGGRGARVVWALRGTHLVVTGFDKVSERQIMVYSASDLSTPLCTVGLDVSPAILHIHIDHDSATLFLTGRGDSTIYCYEVTSEPPYLCALSHHRSPTLHQGIAFLHKNLVAVDKVEFARALRLTNGNIEPLSFTVPRIKSELFQDDLFPATLVTWSPWQSARQWIRGEPAEPRTASLQPPGMECLSAHITPPPVAKEITKNAQKKIESQPIGIAEVGVKDKQENIMKSISAKVQINLRLEQDNMEGVDEAEWEQ